LKYLKVGKLPQDVVEFLVWTVVFCNLTMQFVIFGIVYLKMDITLSKNNTDQFIKVRYEVRNSEPAEKIKEGNAENVKCIFQKEIIEIPCNPKNYKRDFSQEIWRW